MPPIDSKCLQGPATVVDAETFGFLLQQPGAEINHRDASGQSAAFIAARSGNAEALRVACGNGADLALANHDTGATALHMAAGGDYIEATSILLKAGASLDAKDLKGLTPRDYAERNGASKALAEIEAFARGETTWAPEPDEAGYVPEAGAAPGL